MDSWYPRTETLSYHYSMWTRPTEFQTIVLMSFMDRHQRQGNALVGGYCGPCVPFFQFTTIENEIQTLCVLFLCVSAFEQRAMLMDWCLCDPNMGIAASHLQYHGSMLLSQGTDKRAVSVSSQTPLWQRNASTKTKPLLATSLSHALSIVWHS